MRTEESNDRGAIPAGEAAGGEQRPALTRREREILGLLAEGMSGAQIAAKLVLSPETVRTHVRNAMAKLGATTRSQAVALALQRQEIVSETASPGTAQPRARSSAPAPPARDSGRSLTKMLEGLVSLYDVDGGAIYLADEDGLSLRRVAAAADGYDPDLPQTVALGDGPLGRAALERRSQLHRDPGGGASRGGLIAAPILGAGKLLGVIALVARVSRPIGRSELLLLQAFSNRIGEILLSGGDVDRRVEQAMGRFRASWSASTGVV